MVHWLIVVVAVLAAFVLGVSAGSRREREEMARRIGMIALYRPDKLREVFDAAMQQVAGIRAAQEGKGEATEESVRRLFREGE